MGDAFARWVGDRAVTTRELLGAIRADRWRVLGFEGPHLTERQQERARFATLVGCKRFTVGVNAVLFSSR